MSGSGIGMLHIFRALCGEDHLRSVVLVTSCCDMIVTAVGKEREKELTANPNFWGDIVIIGSQVAQYNHSSREFMLEVLSFISTDIQSTVLQIQREIVDKHNTLAQTSAGQILQEETLQSQAELQSKMARGDKIQQRGKHISVGSKTRFSCQ